MLIGVSGNKCSGKNKVREYLELIGFRQLVVNDVDSVTDGVGGIVIASLFGQEKKATSTSQFTFTSPTSLVEYKPSPEEGAESATTFTSIGELLEFATKNWSQNFVVEIPDLNTLNELSKRPFFLHVAVDAPTTVRWKRYNSKRKEEMEKAGFIPSTFSPTRSGRAYAQAKRRPITPPSTPALTFQQFVDESDSYLFGRSKGAILLSKAQVVIINSADSVSELFVNIGKLNLTLSTRLRPSWDAYFMQLADLAAQRSNCMKRRVGCVLVRDKRVIATGYNGTPRGLQNCNEGGCKRCNMAQGAGAGLSTCLCLHAEENAILEAGRDRLGTQGILYCNTCPCLTCSIKIVQSGIREVVYSQSYSMDNESAKVLEAGEVLLRQYSAPVYGLVM